MEQLIDESYRAQLEYAKAEQLERTNAIDKAMNIYRRVMNSAIEPYASQAAARLKEFPIVQKNPEVPTTVSSAFEFKISTVQFSDVIGLAPQKEIIKNHIGLPMKYPERFDKMRIKYATGLLLYGAPGVGKTMLLKAASSKYNLPLADVKGSDIKGSWFGDSEKAWGRLFATAREIQPCIILIDELDDLGAKKDGINSNEGSSEAKKGLVTALVKHMSEVRDNNEKIFICGATNAPWNIELALRRSGRFDFTIYVAPPGLLARAKMLKKEYEKMDKDELGAHMNFLWLALATSGFSPADIERVMYSAMKKAIRDNKKVNTSIVQSVLKDRIEGKSTLDDWYKEMRSLYLGPKRKPRKGQPEQHPGRFTKEDKKQYREIVADVNSRERWALLVWLSRIVCRGI